MPSVAKCSVDGCETKPIARGWCSKHYQRWQTTGDPLGAKTATEDMTADERLRYIGWDVTESECWEWRGNRFHKGYAQIRYQGKTRSGHRLAYETWVGPIPEGMLIMHICDNPPCINPDHLRVGTNDENMADMLAKNRQAAGERHGNYKHGKRVGILLERRRKVST